MNPKPLVLTALFTGAPALAGTPPLTTGTGSPVGHADSSSCS
ncbi:hypothetical protein ATI61_10649 [Archangium gephyra]|uniref:Uncharacterized protein n=1 Tax=Archangium gephyra TaxID=48 RepID=A0AAC8TA71_9BACT|nr:hypothetical protein [Archangium gephyra]AKI98649.1 Hypothetical protein AA314_00276 [Archangium gephyra]REG30580.1 hypothetical protein ATI61_10649 [Archangium gephyra]